MTTSRRSRLYDQSEKLRQLNEAKCNTVGSGKIRNPRRDNVGDSLRRKLRDLEQPQMLFGARSAIRADADQGVFAT